MIEIIQLKWKQFWCKHEWKLLHYFDDYEHANGKERVRIICKKYERTNVRSHEDYEGRVSRKKSHS